MKILDMEETQYKQPIRFHFIKETKDGYIIYYFKHYEFGETLDGKSDQVNIRLRMEVTPDEYYWLQDPENEANINKFRERLDDVLSRYIRRYIK